MHLCFATSTNRWPRRDGNYFVSEMMKYKRVWDQVAIVEKIPAANKNKLRGQIIEKTSNWIHQYPYNPVDHFAFFMHGTAKWLIGAGLNIWNSDQWVATLPPGRRINVALYSCSNGSWINRTTPGSSKYSGGFDLSKGVMRGEYGFAMRLGWQLYRRGHPFQIYAHTTKGDTTRNPYAVWITWNPGDTEIKREWVIKPPPKKAISAVREKWKAWVTMLKSDNFRFRVPYMTRDELDKTLEVVSSALPWVR